MQEPTSCAAMRPTHAGERGGNRLRRATRKATTTATRTKRRAEDGPKVKDRISPQGGQVIIPYREAHECPRIKT
jgi:hypothetical protein